LKASTYRSMSSFTINPTMACLGFTPNMDCTRAAEHNAPAEPRVLSAHRLESTRIEDSVPCSCCTFTSAAGHQFNAKKATKQLRAYRRGQVGPTMRFLRDGL
jgi:hypothetical protein